VAELDFVAAVSVELRGRYVFFVHDGRQPDRFTFLRFFGGKGRENRAGSRYFAGSTGIDLQNTDFRHDFGVETDWLFSAAGAAAADSVRDSRRERDRPVRLDALQCLVSRAGV